MYWLQILSFLPFTCIHIAGGEENLDGNAKKPVDETDAVKPLIGKSQEELDDEEEKEAMQEKKKKSKAAARELTLVEKTYEQLGWGTYIHEVCLYASCSN